MMRTEGSNILTPPPPPPPPPLQQNLRPTKPHRRSHLRRNPNLLLLMLPLLRTSVLSLSSRHIGRRGGPIASTARAFLRPLPPSSLRTTGLSSPRTVPSLRTTSSGDRSGDDGGGDGASPSWMDRNEEFRRYEANPVPGAASGPPPPASKSAAEYDREYDVSDRRREKQKRRRRKRSGVEHNDRVEAGNRENRKRKDETFRENFRGTRVFVQNLPDSANWQDVKDHFKIAGEVVFASVSIDTRTGLSKNCGVVQYETTDAARNAIRTMRDHPLNGSVLYVREDFQERNDEPPSSTTTPSTTSPQSTPRTLASVWRCADSSNASHLPPAEYAAIERLIQTRDRSRRARDYDASDALRQTLKVDHRVHLDDRLKTWWYSVDGSTVPDAVRGEKGEGRWGAPPKWRRVPTTVENDACVDPDLVEGLLRQRDVARREKDFGTADRLLEEVKYAPEGGDSRLTILVNDEERSWRIWTEEKPRWEGVSGGGGGGVGETVMSGEDKCIALVMKHEPEKVEEVKAMLKRFPGREYSILKRLKENYFK